MVSISFKIKYMCKFPGPGSGHVLVPGHGVHPGHHVQLAADVRWQVHPFGGDQLVRPGGGACNWGE